MSQNVSTAVMQRRVEPHDSLDDFPTQPWATRALIEYVLKPDRVRDLTAWEPACNRGHMAKPLGEYFKTVRSTDIHDYGWEGQESVEDFLFADLEKQANWIITNPPFRLAEQFIDRAFKVRGWLGTAMIVRTSFLESVGRYQNLFSIRPPTLIAQYSERVPMVKGRLTATGSTATSYCWLVWQRDTLGTRFVWIPPCRKLLEREGDYA